MLSFSTLNKLFNAVPVIMLQYPEHVERCLVWILAIVRNKEKLANNLSGHTKRDLLEALDITSKEPSKRGLLASLLKSQLSRS